MNDVTPPTPADARPEPVRSPLDMRHPETAACLLMLAVVLLTGDDARRFPLWPEAWGLAPPLNSVLLLLALILMIHRIASYTAEAASNLRNAR